MPVILEKKNPPVFGIAVGTLPFGNAGTGVLIELPKQTSSADIRPTCGFDIFQRLTGIGNPLFENLHSKSVVTEKRAGFKIPINMNRFRYLRQLP